MMIARSRDLLEQAERFLLLSETKERLPQTYQGILVRIIQS